MRVAAELAGDLSTQDHLYARPRFADLTCVIS
jgi:hypothetical protein